MTKTIHGKIHGKTIELDEDLGMAEGQEVEVQVTIVQPARQWGMGILAQRAVGWTTQKWTPLWRRFTRTGNWSGGLRWMTNEPPAGHQHLFGSFSPTEWAGASVYPVRRWLVRSHRRFG